MNENKVVIIWRRAIFFGKGYQYMGTRLSEACMELMFSETIEAKNIELFVEVEKDMQPHTQPTMTYDVGTSMREEQLSFPDDVGTSRRDIGEQFDVGENTEVPTHDSDFQSDEEFSDREEELSNESSEDNASDDEVIGGPLPYSSRVCKEISEAEYVHRGKKYFRSLPSESDDASNFGCNEEGTWYWDEKNPTHIGLGTKFDTKLHLKTAMTLWHISAVKQYKVVESKSKRWHAVCKFPKGAAGHETSEACMWEI